jgi:hypothetical protein
MNVGRSILLGSAVIAFLSSSDFAGLLKDHAMAVFHVLTTRWAVARSYTTPLDSTRTWHALTARFASRPADCCA